MDTHTHFLLIHFLLLLNENFNESNQPDQETSIENHEEIPDIISIIGSRLSDIVVRLLLAVLFK